MLTRLKVSGFKNLVDVDIHFGPFTCVAGANGVGKSNLFDAIQFLSALADNTLIEAALSIRRSESGRTSDIRSLFHRAGNEYADTIDFEAEMIISPEGVDDLGQEATATITFVRYKLSLAYRLDADMPMIGGLELLREELEHINLSDAPKHLRFPHSASRWRRSAVSGRRSSSFISTTVDDSDTVIRLHQDGGSKGQARKFLAKTLPRTVLSTVNATENPTALLARREMQSWRLLQLEPSALREPDDFTTKPGLGSDGSHLPATLYHLGRTHLHEANGKSADWLYQQVSNRLSELIDDVFSLDVDRDEKRQLLTLEVTDKARTRHPARSLSDGTLRFLALAVLEQDPTASGLICLEEPENGIHPKRIAAMLRLLQDIAVDVDEPIGPDNPLRQVIVNTHSPVVVNEVKDDDLLVAEQYEIVKEGQRFKSVRFSWLPDTWRAEAEPERLPVAKGKVLAYLKHVLDFSDPRSQLTYTSPTKKPMRVGERTDLQPELPILKD
jgi:predicted ATPase